MSSSDEGQRNGLLASIANTISDYRAGEIPQPDAAHVGRWISQFDTPVQVPILLELDHVLARTYYSRERVRTFLADLSGKNKLTRADPCFFWRGVNILQIQKNGRSQKELLDVFDEVLRARCGFGVDDCGSKEGPFLYLDDAVFSGSRVGNDLNAWILRHAPQDGKILVCAIATHTLGEFLVRRRLQKVADEAKKGIKLELWRADSFENRKSERASADVLWPVSLPETGELKRYLEQEQRYPFEPRPPGGRSTLNLFSSEASRQTLEREMVLAGMRIRGLSQNPAGVMRPLGFSPFGVGFGSMIVTFRNCPNNCPLPLWWGDPTASSSHPLSRWYPLFPRKTYALDSDFEVVEVT